MKLSEWSISDLYHLRTFCREELSNANQTHFIYQVAGTCYTDPKRYEQAVIDGRKHDQLITDEYMPKLKAIDKEIDKKIKFLAFTSLYTYCRKCNSTFIGIREKCPSCFSRLLECFGRSSSLVIPFNNWHEAKKKVMDKWVRYSP